MKKLNLKYVLSVVVLCLQLLGATSQAAYSCYCESTYRAYGASHIAYCQDKDANKYVKEYAYSSGECYDIIEKIQSTAVTSKSCYCANSALWCGQKYEGRFNSDNECKSYLSKILSNK